MDSNANPLRRAQSTNSSNASALATLIPTATKPSGTGVIDLQDPDYGYGMKKLDRVPQWLNLIPIGTDANNETFDMQVWGWKRGVSSSGDDQAEWTPILLLQLAVTLGNIDASAVYGTNSFMADTLTVTHGQDDAGSDLVAPISTAADFPASCRLHLRGCELVEFEFSNNGKTAATMNCLWAGEFE